MAIIHFAPLRLGAGSTIEPGNWGRLLRTHAVFQVTGDPTKSLATGALTREYIFEVERLRNFSHLPSRLSCCFACPTEDDAAKFAAKNNINGMQVAHEVEPIITGANSHTAALTFCNIPLQGFFLPPCEANARGYWRGDQGATDDGREILYDCGLRIVRCLD